MQRNTRQATSINGDDRPRTKEELQQLFAWWDKEMQVDEAVAKQAATPPQDSALLKMAFPVQVTTPSKLTAGQH